MAWYGRVMIRVMIERRLRPGRLEDFRAAMRAMRGAAVQAPGYLAGEMMHPAGEPDRHVTISTWRSRDDWAQWQRSETRRRTEERLAALVEEERITVLEPE